MCICILLVLFVICGLILTTVFIVKNLQSNSEEKHGIIDYLDVGNNEILETNKKLTRHPDIKNDYFLTSVEGNAATTSSTLEYTAATIESPLSTSTMSPKDIPPRFLIVNTVSAIDISNSDYSTASSTNDYFQSTTKGKIDKSLNIKRSTEMDFRDEPITIDDDLINAYLQWTRMMNDEEAAMKGATDIDINESTTQLETQENHQTCTTNSCKQSTSRMLALINHTAKPCDDFYSYACGGFEINHFNEFTVNDNVLELLPGLKQNLGSRKIIPKNNFYCLQVYQRWISQCLTKSCITISLSVALTIKMVEVSRKASVPFYIKFIVSKC